MQKIRKLKFYVLFCSTSSPVVLLFALYTIPMAPCPNSPWNTYLYFHQNRCEQYIVFTVRVYCDLSLFWLQDSFIFAIICFSLKNVVLSKVAKSSSSVLSLIDIVGGGGGFDFLFLAKNSSLWLSSSDSISASVPSDFPSDSPKEFLYCSLESASSLGSNSTQNVDWRLWLNKFSTVFALVNFLPLIWREGLLFEICFKLFIKVSILLFCITAVVFVADVSLEFDSSCFLFFPWLSLSWW